MKILEFLGDIVLLSVGTVVIIVLYALIEEYILGRKSAQRIDHDTLLRKYQNDLSTLEWNQTRLEIALDSLEQQLKNLKHPTSESTIIDGSFVEK